MWSLISHRVCQEKNDKRVGQKCKPDLLQWRCLLPTNFNNFWHISVASIQVKIRVYPTRPLSSFLPFTPSNPLLPFPNYLSTFPFPCQAISPPYVTVAYRLSRIMNILQRSNSNRVRWAKLFGSRQTYCNNNQAYFFCPACMMKIRRGLWCSPLLLTR